VGSERPPKRGIGIEELNLEDKSGKSIYLSSGDSLIKEHSSKTTSSPQPSGTTVPEPQSGTSRPETHGGFVPQGHPTVPSAPQKENPRTVWTVWNKDQRNAYFETFPESERKGQKLETIFAAMTEKPSNYQDFLTLIAKGNDPKVIGETLIWAVQKSGHWEFHNSKHFCKDSVYSVVEQQYLAWYKKNRRAKKAAA